MDDITDTESELLETEQEEEFAFETDHLALRGNKDYYDMIKYIVKLEAQKVQALTDIEMLADEQRKALENPIEFIQNLQSGTINFMPRQTIDNLPEINWRQYGIDISTEDDHKDIKPSASELETKVRGRTFTDSKPETFNQLWSCEEQKRLEELLEIYPEEPGRFKKIAHALGTRTPSQVMSRVQKYFSKLAKAGFPIPGRRSRRTAKERRAMFFYKKSTFFPQLHVPVKMEDPCDTNDSMDSMSSMEAKNSNKYMLELLKLAKEQRTLDEIEPVCQSHTMCVGCQNTGFLGARWTDNAGTDYCTDCVVKLLPAEKLIPVRR